MLARLSVLMFLQYSVPGVVLPLYSARLDSLGFSPWQIALCSATHGVASILAPLMGQLADRWLSARKCLAMCGILAALDLAWLLMARDFWPMFMATQLFWLLAVPMMILGTTITFTHLEHPEAQFGFARLWGTVGWMAAPWILFAVDFLPGPKASAGDTLIMVGMAMSLSLVAYTLTLPDTPPRHVSGATLAPVAILRRLAGTSFFTFAACMAGFCVIQPFAIQGTPLLLQELVATEWGPAAARTWLAPLITIAQVSEITCLALLPAFLNRLEQRGSMLLGLGTWCLILMLLAFGHKPWIVLLSLALNGPVITGFLVVGQVYLNSRARGDLKASAQSLMASIQGAGLIAGHLLFGALRSESPPGGMVAELPAVFTLGAMAALGLTILLWAGFRPDRDALEDA